MCLGVYLIDQGFAAIYGRAKLAPIDCRSENVRVPPVVVAELEFGDIERHIFAAHFVECTDHTALKDRPEAFDGLSVDCANDILPPRVINSRVRIILVERIVARILIGTKQADFMGYGFADEGGESGGIHVRNHAGDDIPLAADRADDRSFAGTDAARSAAAAALIPMPVFSQAADESFIDFDNSAELIDVLHESGSNLVAHEPSGFIGAEAHVTMDLARANSLLAGQHKMNDTKPIAERFIRVFENRPGDVGKAIAFRRASVALPMPRLRGNWISLYSPATRAADAFRPPPADEVRTTSIFVGKHRFELGDAHLMNLRGLFCSSHDHLSFVGETIA
jgi:hypothetical protein